jgi:hypothetical protein
MASEATVHHDGRSGVHFVTRPFVTETIPEGFTPFDFYYDYIPKDSSGTGIVWCESKGDFLRLIESWNRSMPRHWHYSPMEDRKMAHTEPKALAKGEDGKYPAHAWPGGYPIFYFDNENNVLCPKCANKERMSTVVTASDINWENGSMFCDDCGENVECAYCD